MRHPPTAALALVWLCAGAEAQTADPQADPVCLPRQEVADALRDAGEARILYALASPQTVMEIWASAGGETWTAVIVGPVQAGIVGDGIDIEIATPPSI